MDGYDYSEKNGNAHICVACLCVSCVGRCGESTSKTLWLLCMHADSIWRRAFARTNN